MVLRAKVEAQLVISLPGRTAETALVSLSHSLSHTMALPGPVTTQGGPGDQPGGREGRREILSLLDGLKSDSLQWNQPVHS